MNKLIKIFRYAGFSLVFISLTAIANHLIEAVNHDDDGQLPIDLMGNDAFKPTLKQSIILWVPEISI